MKTNREIAEEIAAKVRHNEGHNVALVARRVLDHHTPQEVTVEQIEAAYNDEFAAYRRFGDWDEIDDQQLFIAFVRALGYKVAEPIESQPLTPIPGPPDLEGVPDEALFLLVMDREPLDRRMAEADTVRVMVEANADIKWHIPLGVIEPPEPELPQTVYLRKTEYGTWEETTPDNATHVGRVES